MENNNTNIFQMDNRPRNQQRINIFDKAHSSSKPTNIFNTNSQQNYSQTNTQTTNINSVTKIPAINIFGNKTDQPKTNIFQSINSNSLFKSPQAQKSLSQVKNEKLEQKEQNQTNGLFSTPDKKPLSSPFKEQRRTQNAQNKRHFSPKTYLSPESKKINRSMQDKKPQSNSKSRDEKYSSSSSGKKGKSQSGKKSQDYSDFSGNYLKLNENQPNDQTISVQEKTPSASSFYTFQKKTDSRKLQNPDMADYFIDQGPILPAQQKVQTPKKVQQQKEMVTKDQKLLSVIKQIEGQQSPQHPIQVSKNLHSSQISSSPSYMNQNSSPNVSYMDRTSSKNTGQKITLFKDAQNQKKENKQYQNPLLKNYISTKSQGYINLQQSLKPREIQQSHKSSIVKINEKQSGNLLKEEEGSEKEKKNIKFREFLQIYSGNKNLDNEFKNVEIKRIESQSDSQSHSFSSRDLTATKIIDNTNQKSKGSLLQKPQIQNFSQNHQNLKVITNNQLKVNLTKEQQGWKLQMRSQQSRKQYPQKFIEVEQVNIREQDSHYMEKDEEKISENSQKTISLNYSQTTNKIQSLSNTLGTKSFFNDDKIQQKLIVGNKRVQTESKIQMTKEEDLDDLQVPLTNERKITFGKSSQSQNLFAISLKPIQSKNQLQTKQQFTSIKNTNQTSQIFKGKNIFQNQKTQIITQKQTQSAEKLKQTQSAEKVFVQKSQNRHKISIQIRLEKGFKNNVHIHKQEQLRSKQTNMLSLQRMRNDLSQKKNIINQAKECNRYIFSNFKAETQQIKNTIPTFNTPQYLILLNDTVSIVQPIIEFTIKTQNYLHLSPDSENYSQIASKVKLFYSRIQKREKQTLQCQKWTQKIRQIQMKYLLDLDSQRRERQKQLQQKQNKSLFSVLNLKKNKYSSPNNPVNKQFPPNKTKYQKSLQIYQQALKSLLQSKTQISLKYQNNVKQISNIKTNVSLTLLQNINKPQNNPLFEQKQILQARVQNILKGRQISQKNIKIKSSPFLNQLFNQQKYKQNIMKCNLPFFKLIKMNFMRKLQNNPQNDKTYLIKEKTYFQPQKNSINEEFINFLTKMDIKNLYEKGSKAAKKERAVFSNVLNHENHKLQNQNGGLKQERRILQRIEFRKEMGQKLRNNVSVKLKSINFRPQIFVYHDV